MMYWTPNIKAVMITNVKILELVTVLAPGNMSRDEIFDLARRGKSAIKRLAIVPRSGCVDGPPGNSAINKTNLRIAASRGNRANSLASCQGSTSDRASAERTLSSIPFLSSPIGANRKLSNSDPRGEIEVQRVIFSHRNFVAVYRSNAYSRQ